MTGNELLILLGTRLEDESEDRFTKTMKLQFLNTAQHSLTNALNNELLSELQTVKDGVNLSSGKYSLVIDPVILRQSIILVKLGGYIATRIQLRDLKDIEHPDLAGTSTDPKYYIIENYIYGVGCSATAALIITYIKEASDITASDSEVTDINAAYHHLLLDYAEYLAFKSVKDERAGESLKQYLDKVKVLNERYTAKSTG